MNTPFQYLYTYNTAVFTHAGNTISIAQQIMQMKGPHLRIQSAAFSYYLSAECSARIARFQLVY